MKRIIAIFSLAGLTGVAMAQFVNGNFETGDFTGWTITPTTNGQSNPTNVVQFDIDGPGSLGTNFSGQFSVGQVVFQSGVQAGIEITQMLNLSAGTAYTFDFDWAATRTSTGSNSQGGVFSLIIGGGVFATASAGSTSSTTPHYGHLTASFTPTTSGFVSVGARITRPFTVPAGMFQNVDNFTMSPVPEPATMAVLGLGAAALLRRRRK